MGSVETGISVNDDLLLTLKKKMGFDISIVIPDGDGYKFKARTHSLGIPKKSHAWLGRMMKEDGIHFKQVKKNKKFLLTLFVPLKDYKGNNLAVMAIPRDIGPVLSGLKKDKR